MIQAAINPETGEFLGLIIPKADLGGTVAIYGSTADWETILAGGAPDQAQVGIAKSPRIVNPECDIWDEALLPDEIERVEVGGLE
jgi:hypothetical protein